MCFNYGSQFSNFNFIRYIYINDYSNRWSKRFTLISVYNGYKNAEDPEGMEVVITNLIDNLTDFPASDVKSFEPSDSRSQ